MKRAPLVRWAEPGSLDAVAERVAAEVARPGVKRIAIAGGSTPAKVLERLVDRDLDWAGATIVPTDDRQVPDDHPASNFGKLKLTLGSSGATISPLVEGDRPDPFDLVWLGMGEDGHVASLFPHMLAEVRPGRAVIATTPIPLPPEAPYPRLTLNRRALAATKETILVVTGAAKRMVLEAALGGDERYPVSDIVRGARAPVTIYWSE